MNIYLLRHGEPEGGEVFRGRTDHPLTPLGWQQMQTALAEINVQHVVTSPLSRCREFARQFSEARGLPLNIEDDLQEFDFGRFENKSFSSVMAEDYDAIKGLWENPMHYTAPQGEAVLDFEARVLKAWFKVLQIKQENVLVICHGGVIRLLLKEVLGLPFVNINRMDVPYACISQVDVQGHEPYFYRLKRHG
ncbi:MAG: histidine phosphatase family protein [Oceanospirillaceae bacterium]|nr:histidine phosphatase family protein [Oceanospirillaceae bacterium]